MRVLRSSPGKLQLLCVLGLCVLTLLACGCAVEVDPHAGHARHGTATGSTCPPDSKLDYASFGAAFLERYCVDCHSSRLVPSERDGAPFGADYDSLALLQDSGIEHVDYVAAAGPLGRNDFMPPRTFTELPTLEERQRLGEWLACGAP